jgi:hypothetical protein
MATHASAAMEATVHTERAMDLHLRLLAFAALKVVDRTVP